MRCPAHQHQRPDDPNPDRWVKRGHDQCCSYCGSWHPDEFLKFLKQAADPERPEYIEHASNKNYKIYIHRPHIKNASEGAIKFYKWHSPENIDEATQKLYREAMEVSFRKMMRHLDEFSIKMGGIQRPNENP